MKRHLGILLASALALGSWGATAQDAVRPPNVLGEDLFDLFRVMLR